MQKNIAQIRVHKRRSIKISQTVRKISQKRLVAAISLDSSYLFCDKLNALQVYVEIRVM